MTKKSSLRECRLDELLRSDFLPQLLALKEAFPILAPFFPQVLQLRLVVDADRVQSELRWRLRRRRDPAARSALHEAIDAAVLVLFAPRYVIHEIEEHIEEIADETRSTVAEAKHEWALFQRCLCFYSPKSSPSPVENYADINDFPYLATWCELDSQGVYTKDRHLAAMGAPVVSGLIDTHLREYARASSVQLVLQLGSSLSVIVSCEFLCVAYRLFTRSIQAMKRLPIAAQVVLAGVAAYAILHPKSRERLVAGWNSLVSSEAAGLVSEAIRQLVLTADSAKRNAQSHYEHLHTIIPARKQRPLLHHVRAVCVAAHSGLSFDELERRVRRGGYESRSKTFRQYLSRILRSDESFMEVAPGLWSVRATAGSPV